ncbi:MAG: DsbC family protein [Acidiferrobacterales bacterium]
MVKEIATLIAIVVVSMNPLAQAGPVAIKKSMANILPDIPIKSIKPSGISGLFEVRIGTEVYYVTSDGRFLVSGDIIDMKSGRNLTAIARGQVRLELINAVSEDKMIIYKPRKTKRTITVFTDIDCIYCRKFHKDVPTLVKGGIRIRYIVFPRDGLSTSTYQKSVAVWCSRDRKKALTLAKAGGKLKSQTCANPIAEHYELAARVGVRGTPTLITDDGQILSGYVPPDKLFALLGIDNKSSITGSAK